MVGILKNRLTGGWEGVTFTFDGTPEEERLYHSWWKELNQINPGEDCSTCHR